MQSLAAFQANLGRALLGEDTCPVDPHSEGFRFTVSVRRSWCEGRSMLAAREALTLLPENDSQRLISEYVDQGGGLAWFVATEHESFLAFLVQRLPEPSHALTICLICQALAKARRGAAAFVAPRERVQAAPVGRGRHATLVWFHADPEEVTMALKGRKPPSVGPRHHAVLFASGLPHLSRIATEAVAALWGGLPAGDVAPGLVAPLLREGVLEYPDIQTH
jgi:hypothetical protein